MSSFLDEVKDYLGVPKEIVEFDNQLIAHINASLSRLYELGFGPTPAYCITKSSPGDWDEFLPDDESIRSVVLVYMCCKTQLLFDPPSSSFVLTSLTNIINEYEWRFTTYQSLEI